MASKTQQFQQFQPVKFINSDVGLGADVNRTVTAPTKEPNYQRDADGNVVTDGYGKPVLATWVPYVEKSGGVVLPGGAGPGGTSVLNMDDYLASGNGAYNFNVLQSVEEMPYLQTLATSRAKANSNQNNSGGNGGGKPKDKENPNSGGQKGDTPMLRVPLPEKMKMALMQKELPFQINQAPLNSMAVNPLAGAAAGIGDILYNLYGKGALAPRGDNPVSDVVNQLGALPDLARYRALASMNSIERPMTPEEQMQMQLANSLKAAQAYKASGESAKELLKMRLDAQEQMLKERLYAAKGQQEIAEAMKNMRMFEALKARSGFGSGQTGSSTTSFIAGGQAPSNPAGVGLQSK